MKKLFGRAAGSSSAAAPKKDGAGPLTNKTVQVGPHTVLVEHVLGLGGYGEIYRAVDISSGQRFALKHLRLDQENIGEVQREAKTMAKLRGHPNILRLHAVAFAGPKGAETDGFFLLDYCPGTLLDLMGRHKFMLENHTIIHIFSSVCHAVAAMHHQKPPMAHRDLKAENVLMLPDGTWVVCDFGSATSRAQLYDTPAEIAAEEDVISKHTTPAYRPPEMWDLQLMRTRIDTKVDIWALGVLLYVLCFGRLPFAGDSKLQIINARYDMPRSGQHNRPQQLVNLIPGLLQADPTQRPTIDDLLNQVDAVSRAVMGRSILQPSASAGRSSAAAAAGAAAAATAAGMAAGASPLRAEGSFSGLAATAADRTQEPRQQQQSAAELRAAQQQELLREQQLRQYQQQQEETMAQQRQAQHERLQQLQQQQQQQGGSGRGGGSFWNQSEASDSPTAAAGAKQQGLSTAAAAANRSPNSRSEPPPSDWAHFSSPEQSPAGSARQRPHAQFSSSSNNGNSSASASAGATSVRSAGGGSCYGGSSAGGKRAPPAPPAAVPQLSSAGQGVRAHAVAVPSSPLGTPPLGTSPLTSPRRVSGADSPRSDVQGAAAAGGNPFAAERSASGSQGVTAERSGSGGLHMRWQPPAGQRQQQQQQQQWLDGEDLDQVGDANMSQLKDIKARAAAAAAALSAARAPAAARHVEAGRSGNSGGSLGSLSDQHSLGTADRDRDREASMERQPRPYSMSSTSSGATAARPQPQQQQQPWRSAPCVSALGADGVASNVSSPLSPAARSTRSHGSADQQQQQHALPQQSYLQRRPSYEQQQQQQQRAQLEQLPSPRAVLRASSLRSTSMRSDSSVRSDRSGQVASAGLAAAATATTAPLVLPPTPNVVDAAEFDAAMSEVLQLRREVQVLGEQNQAFVFRIKQLEEFTVSQTAAMRQMQLAVEELQRQQRLVAGVVGGSARDGDAAGFSADGGWYNPTRRMSPRVTSDNLR